MSTTAKIFHIANIVALFLVVLSLPLRMFHLLRWIALITFAVTYIADVIVDRRWRNVRLDRKTLYFAIIAILPLLGLLYIPFSDSTAYLGEMLTMRYYLLAFAIVGMFGYSSMLKPRHLIDCFIISSLFYIAFIVAVMYIAPEPWFVYNDYRCKYVAPHMLFNLMLNISLAGATFMLFTEWRRMSVASRLFYISSSVIIIVPLLITEGRTGFVGVFLVLIFIVCEFMRNHKKLLVIPFTVVLVCGVIIVSHQSRMANLSSEPRFWLWENVALPLIEERPVLGYGISDGQSETMRIINENMPPEVRQFFPPGDVRIDVHNQYLQTLIEFGVVGLLLLMFIYVAPLFIVKRNLLPLMLIITVLFMWQSAFDLFAVSPFGLYMGVIYSVLLQRSGNEGIPET